MNMRLETLEAYTALTEHYVRVPYDVKTLIYGQLTDVAVMHGPLAIRDNDVDKLRRFSAKNHTFLEDPSPKALWQSRVAFYVLHRKTRRHFRDYWSSLEIGETYQSNDVQENRPSETVLFR
ncbi:MAG: hypothetical protein WAZ18_01070, partial [Alphaproteobacteria bacterium]